MVIRPQCADGLTTKAGELRQGNSLYWSEIESVNRQLDLQIQRDNNLETIWVREIKEKYKPIKDT